MDIYQSAIIFAVMTLICAYFIAMAYKNVKFVLKHKQVTSVIFPSSDQLLFCNFLFDTSCFDTLTVVVVVICDMWLQLGVTFVV